MLSSRHYMRDIGGQPPRLSIVGWTIVATVAVFVVQNICAFWFRWSGFTDFLGAVPSDLLKGQVWKLLTYALVHDVGQILHLLFNMLMLFWVGRTVLDETGTRRWIWIYTTCALAGSALFAGLYLALGREAQLLGASAAVYGMIGFISTLYPDRPVYFFFIEMRQRWVAITLGAISVFGLLVWEIPGGGTAHSAHLAGMGFGFLIARFGWFSEAFSFGDIRMPAWWKRRSAVATVTRNYTVNIEGASVQGAPEGEVELRAEVDRILDKINSQGFQSLTPAERSMLDKAKDQLSQKRN